MSAETKTALEAALQAHVAAELNERRASANVMVNAYACKVHVIDLDAAAATPVSEYLFIKPDAQEYHVTYGLLLTAQDDFVSSAIEDDD